MMCRATRMAAVNLRRPQQSIYLCDRRNPLANKWLKML